MFEFIRTETGWLVFWGIDPRVPHGREERFLAVDEDERTAVDEDARLTVMAV